jgi:hypothetical protein
MHIGTWFGSAIAAMLCVSCATPRFGAVYPARPPDVPAAPDPDPVPSRIVVHVAVSAAALRASLDRAIPKTGDGTFTLLHAERRCSWERAPVDVSFSQGRIVIDAHVQSTVAMPVGSLAFPIDLHVVAEPVVGTDYNVVLQSTEVSVSSTDRRLKVAEHVAGVFETIASQVNTKLKGFAFDLRGPLAEAYARVDKPIDFPVGGATACAQLNILQIEAGPTVLANGIEKDIAFVVAPSVSMPCIADANVKVDDGAGAQASEGADAPRPVIVKKSSLPALANVTTIQPGPFTVIVPVIASYEELTRAMSLAFTDGKLFFSQEYPGLYLEKPELYESQGEVVLKLHLVGPVHKFGIDTTLDGDLFLSGHVAVSDNELAVPDLEPTIETSNFLLSLKALSDGAKIRDQARAALRLDIGARLRSIKSALSNELTFGDENGCFHGDVDKIEVTGVHAHGTYLRVYVAVTGRASASMPCNTTP